MTQLPLFSAALELVSVPAPIGFDTLVSGLAPNCDVITGLFAFTVLTLAAIAWLTAAPAARRNPTTKHAVPGAAALV